VFYIFSQFPYFTHIVDNQQWCSSTLQSVGLVEVDVPYLAIHLSHRRFIGSRYEFFCVQSSISRVLKLFLALGRQAIHCADVELAQIIPPAGLSCAQYLNRYISANGGYLTNPDATTACSFCSISSADTFLANSFNIYYDHHWRNFGIMIAFTVLNVRCFLSCLSIARAHPFFFFYRLLRFTPSIIFSALEQAASYRASARKKKLVPNDLYES
jgi:hypothetical protein